MIAMRRGRCCRRPASALLIAVALLVAPRAAHPVTREWYEYYRDAEKALGQKRWAEAASMLVEATRLKPDPGVALPTYGMQYLNYFPYLKLGIAYYNLGNYEGALQMFEREEKAGAVLRSSRDRQDLDAFRKLAREAQSRARDAENERLRQRVDESIREAQKLEEQGKFTEALDAASRASAADPSNKDASALVERLRQKQREQEAETRREQIVREGRSMRDAGKLEEAANLFNQAQSMRADPEVRALLEDTRAMIRSQMEATRSVEERKRTVQSALADALKLEGEKRYTDALGKLQTVLALEPSNKDALAMQTRLTTAAVEKSKVEEVLRALTDGMGHLKQGRAEMAVTELNHVLAIDPNNADARQSFLQALQQMNAQFLSESRQSPKIAPIIVLYGGGPNGSGQSAETVSDPDVPVSGTVLDDGPEVTISFSTTPTGAGDAMPRMLLKGQKSVGLYRFEFERRLRIEPGMAVIRVTAVDADKLTAAADRRIVYARPWHRSPWALAGAATTLLLGFGGVFAWKARLRAHALQRRYNPFVAGTPVLREESFFGREALIQRILQSVHNNSILLYGERRIGKTSIQHHLQKRLQKLHDAEYEFYPVFVDIQGVPQEKFFATLAGEVFHELGEKIDPALGSRDPRSDPGYDYESLVKDLRAVLKSLNAKAAKRAKLVLLIDEVDELNEYDPRINQRLRSLFMKRFAEDVNAVVSGVAIKRKWESEGSPWYNFFEEIEVKPFTRADAVELIERPIRGIFDVEPGVTEHIIELTQCRPYLIQRLCMSIVSRLYEQKRRRISLEDVRAVEPLLEGRTQL